MTQLEVVVRLKIRPGQLGGFKRQVGELLRVTRERDAHTLRCDWYVDEDSATGEVHEMFDGEPGLVEHKMHTMEATAVLLERYASDHRATIYGTVSDDFVKLVEARMGAAPTVFSFVQGLGRVIATATPVHE